MTKTAVVAAAGAVVASAVSFLCAVRHLGGPSADAASGVAPLSLAAPAFPAQTAFAVCAGRTRSPYEAPVASALKRVLGAASGDSGGRVARFLEESGIAGADLRWLALSMDRLPVSPAGELEGSPTFVLAVSFGHDLARVLASYDRLKDRNSPLSFELCGDDEVTAWKIVAAGWGCDGGDVDASAYVASLDGEILLLASDLGSLVRQVRIYEGRPDEPPLRPGLGPDEAVKVLVPGFGAFLGRVLPVAADAPSFLDELFPGGKAAFLALGGFTLSAFAPAEGGLRLEASANAASAEDAESIATLARAGAQVLAAGRPGDGGMVPEALREVLRWAGATSDGERVTVSLAIPDAAVRSAAESVAASLGI